jgi:hypothetical protein
MRERGTGSIFRKAGTKFWWIAYSFRGHSYQESSKSTDKKDAEALLKERLHQIANGSAPDARELRLYVIQRGDDGPIKIGISRQPKQRLRSLQTGSAEKLTLLRVYRMADVERAIHIELERESRLNGEWFPADLLPSVERFFNGVRLPKGKP